MNWAQRNSSPLAEEDVRELEHESNERLAAAFDRAVDILADGGELSLDELAQGCEELRPQLAEVLRLAREVAVRPSETLPDVPGFEVERELGRGGMGTVYLARQARVGGRRVALKVLPQLASANARARERFATEVRALSKLAHPGVVAIHDVVLERDVCAYAMEWIDGSSLADQIRAGAFGVERAAQVCELALVIARALHAAHEVGVIHRDVKPSNILLRRDGTPLLADFGLARDDESASASRSGGFVGTPAYAAPEQLRGDSSAIDARTDVYSLGATIYHALIGRPPHEGRTSEQLLRQIERGARRSLRSVDSRLSRELETIVDKCLESDAGRRYASAAELADDLERLLKLQPIRARPAGWLVRASKLVRRNRATAWGAVAGSLVSLAAAAALVAYVFFVPRWVDEHVRDARLALLDPRGANAVFVAASWKLGPERVDPVASAGGLEVALEQYDAALRWRPFDDELRDERDAVAVALRLPRSASAPPSTRARGLSEFLERRVDSALELWSAHDRTRDPLAPPDPLLEAFVGLLHLVEERPALAYPRLRLAALSFPDVGFLATYLADAALGSGDLEFAERTLERAMRMPHLDPTAAHERVRADLLAARGLDAQAEELYRSLTYNPVALLHFARFLESRGRREDAVQELTARPFELRSTAARRELVRLFERWWDGLNEDQRLEQLALARTLPPHDPRSLVARCEVYVHARGGQRFSPAGMNPRERFSSPTLESLGFPELANHLERSLMHSAPAASRRSSTTSGAPHSLNFAGPASTPFQRLVGFARGVALHAAVGALAVSGTTQAQCWATYDATLGTLPTAQGFQADVGNSPPPATVNAGLLHIGPTTTAQSLSFVKNGLPIDFSTGFALEAEFEVLDSECGVTNQLPRFGFEIAATDLTGRYAFVQFCSTHIYLASHPYLPTNGGTVVVVPYTVVGNSHHLRLDVNASGLELRVDGVLVASAQPSAPVFAPNAPNAWFGDGTEFAAGDTLVRNVKIGVPCVSAYCTAGTTSSGCNASMSSSGTPSVAATSGFTLNCSNIEGQKFGLIFYGVSGPAASVWAPGSTSYLCVKSPVQRTTSGNSGGTAGACDGALSIDFLSYLSTHPVALGQPFAAGQCVNAQTWFRDPPAPGTTNLSNGLQFVTTP